MNVRSRFIDEGSSVGMVHTHSTGRACCIISLLDWCECAVLLVIMSLTSVQSNVVGV